MRQWSERTPPGNDQSVVHGFRKISKEVPHLLSGLETVLRRKPPSVRLVEIRAIGNADQRVVRFLHRLIGVVRIVGRHEWKLELISKIDQGRFDPTLLRKSVALQFDVQASREHICQGPQVGLSGRTLMGSEQFIDGTERPAGQGNQSVSTVSQLCIRDIRYAAVLRREIRLAR